MQIVWTWTDREGRDVTNTEAVLGYNVQDFFDTPLDEIQNSRAPGEVRSLLRAAYRGRDVDGIGLTWEVG